jgi:hypothetical protein
VPADLAAQTAGVLSILTILLEYDRLLDEEYAPTLRARRGPGCGCARG